MKAELDGCQLSSTQNQLSYQLCLCCAFTPYTLAFLNPGDFM
jgi:hypothetical protein